jgi:hypothetical protein
MARAEAVKTHGYLAIGLSGAFHKIDPDAGR